MNNQVSSRWNRRRFGAAGLALASGLVGVAGAADKPVYKVLVAEGARLAYVLPILKLIAEGGGFDWDVVHVPFPRLMLMMGNGEGLGWGISRTREREPVFAFSEVVNTRNVWLVAPAGKPPTAPSLAAMKGRSYCKRRGFTLDSPLNEALRDRHFTAVEADLDYDAVLRMMLAGRCEGVLFTHRSFDPAVVERRLEVLASPASRFVVQSPPLATGTIHLACAKNKPELLAQMQRVNQGLRAQAAAIKEILASEV